MKKIILLIFALIAVSAAYAVGPLLIERQGQFAVGGTTIVRPGTFDPDTFVGWTNPVQDGQRYCCDHTFAQYQIPVNAKKLPLVFVHGFGGSSHFLMQNLNNDVIAVHVATFLRNHRLAD